MKSLVEIETTMPVFVTGFAEAKTALIAELDKYKKVVVTEETLKDDKKLAQTLSAKGRSYDEVRKAKVKEVSVPIEKFKGEMDELKELCTKASSLIKTQVEVFETAKLVTIGKLLESSINTLRDDAKIDKEFRVIGSEKKYIKLGSVTAGGKLVKGAKDGIATLVAAELAHQGKIEFRLLQLENESRKAGLDSPLVRVNVELFLFHDDTEYSKGLERIIKSELERQANAEAARKEKEKIANEVEAARLKALEPVEDTPIHDINLSDRVSNPDQSGAMAVLHNENGQLDTHVNQHHHSNINNDSMQGGEFIHDDMPNYDQHQGYQPDNSHVRAGVDNSTPALKPKPNTMSCTVVAKFKVTVPVSIKADMITNKLKGMLANAGIKSLESIEVFKDA